MHARPRRRHGRGRWRPEGRTRAPGRARWRRFRGKSRRETIASDAARGAQLTQAGGRRGAGGLDGAREKSTGPTHRANAARQTSIPWKDWHCGKLRRRVIMVEGTTAPTARKMFLSSPAGADAISGGGESQKRSDRERDSRPFPAGGRGILPPSFSQRSSAFLVIARVSLSPVAGRPSRRAAQPDRSWIK